MHSLSISYDQADYDALIAAYIDNGEKEWIEATVVIDGVTFDDVGLKLKGNSSLRGLSTEADADLSADNPEDLPWIVDIDKFVDGQEHDGSVEFVIRGNSSETSLNEAVALDLLEASGLAAEQAVATRVEVNGAEALRLVVENPDDSWVERALTGSTALYKAESGGDYSYRGDDPESYVDVFDQEAGEDDLSPLIDFLQFINESDDATFEAELGQHLDVTSFATYLAFQELVDNFDDIDGPGNNSYLSYDASTGLMTVVSWDLNLAFGASPGGGGQGQGQGQARGQGQAQGQPQVQGGGGGAQGGGSNVLSERFLANPTFAALYQSELDRLTQELYTSGLAQNVLDSWTHTLDDGASDLVSTDVVSSEASSIAGYFTE
ncbi:CotH kinase family protein [Microbacterium sp. RURRCA19A]|uniref:CotH kinase family protein n=1 Tax=Microbacterium sp. RURRCA19A TaxID=1907391 RepID=UPI0020C94DE2|nr:CotH kinase family protein [Microbacterium sp. RURRCA19A]